MEEEGRWQKGMFDGTSLCQKREKGILYLLIKNRGETETMCSRVTDAPYVRRGQKAKGKSNEDGKG